MNKNFTLKFKVKVDYAAGSLYRIKTHLRQSDKLFFPPCTDESACSFLRGKRPFILGDRCKAAILRKRNSRLRHYPVKVTVSYESVGEDTATVSRDRRLLHEGRGRERVVCARPIQRGNSHAPWRGITPRFTLNYGLRSFPPRMSRYRQHPPRPPPFPPFTIGASACCNRGEPSILPLPLPALLRINHWGPPKESRLPSRSDAKNCCCPPSLLPSPSPCPPAYLVHPFSSRLRDSIFTLVERLRKRDKVLMLRDKFELARGGRLGFSRGI